MQHILLNDQSTSGIFIEANILQAQAIPQACIQALEALDRIRNQYPDENIGLTIGFGHRFWQTLPHSNEAPDLKDFPSYGKGDYYAPATQCDLLIHIQSQNQDSNLTLAMNVLNIFADAIEVKQEIHGFRRHEHRGLDGFVDGTENPKGEKDILSIGLDKHGGSYVMFQRYVHDLAKWDTYSISDQETSVGRSKQTDEEFSKEIRHPRSHLGRSNLKENGIGLKIVRRSLPFAHASGEKGLAFIAYAGKLHNIEAQLQHMFGESEDGLTDFLLERLSQAKSGAYYYAPSAERLRHL